MIRTSFLLFLICILNSGYSQSQLWGLTQYGGNYASGVVFKTDGSGDNYSAEYHFTKFDGAYPIYTHLTEASNGMLYGMCSEGGMYSSGIIFEYNPITNVYTKQVDLNGSNGDMPNGSLMQASNGWMYGMTKAGGAFGKGVLFRFNPTSKAYNSIMDFDGSNGSSPNGNLIQASNGILYGMTTNGGLNDAGVLFQFNPANQMYTKIMDFGGTIYGQAPFGSLVQASDGKLYGVTSAGGLGSAGVLFQYDITTNTCTKKANMKGKWPKGSLIEANDGKLYGLAEAGGTSNKGTLFQYDPVADTIMIKLNFNGTTQGSYPYGSLIKATNGMLYGMCSQGGANNSGVIFVYNPVTGTSGVVKNFSSSQEYFPNGSLMQASNGKMYGMTNYDGTLPGALFDLDISTGIYTKKLTFGMSIEGKSPVSSIMLASNNKFYGMTPEGGVNNVGVIFQYDPTIYQYNKLIDLNTTNGSVPSGNLLEGTDGMFYGLTYSGGINNQGVLFQYDPNNATYMKKVDFTGAGAAGNGSYPKGSLIQAADGMLYGVTSTGGVNNYGVLFQYDPTTNIYTRKISFTGGGAAGTGSAPEGSLFEASDGKLYGMTKTGGANNQGVLFQYDPVTATLVKKIDFNGSALGGNPTGALIEGVDNNLYGLTSHGGGYGYGVLFQYNPVTNILTKKVTFDGSAKGMEPFGGLLLAINGKMYGTTKNGGANNVGTIFQYDYLANVFTKKVDMASSGGQNPSFGNLIEVPLSITTLSVGTHQCANNTVSVSYSIQGSYNSNNVFTAQLSDSGGSFSNPVNIGIITSATPAVINAIIPSGTNSGSNYRIRVVSNSPNVIGSNNGNNIIIYAAPVLTLSSSATSLCLGDSVELAITGAATYTWSTGSSASTITVTPSASQSYTVNGTDINNCVNSAAIHVNVNNIPAINITGNTSLCLGSGSTLTATSLSTYTWSTGDSTPSINILPSGNTTYTVSGTDMNNCSNTQTVTVTVDPTCADVWPGDANSDGIADNLDILELGLHYTQTGTPRAAVNNNWQSYFADNWTGTITNGKNLNHSDCNGDGTINDDDTLAIYNNYGLTHAFKQSAQPVTNPQLTIVPDQPMVATGAWGSSSIYLGEPAISVVDVNGVAFTVDFDNTLIEPGSIYLEYHTSFMNANSDNLHFRKLDFGSGKIYTATTHTNNTNVSGNGKIATLHYRIKTGLTTDEILNLGLSLANQSAATGTVTPLTTGTGTLMALGSSVGVNELNNGNIISIIPNPASSFVTISSTADLKTIEVMNIAGQTVLSQKANSTTQQINIEELANGIYMVKTTSVNGSATVKRLVINK